MNYNEWLEWTQRIIDTVDDLPDWIEAIREVFRTKDAEIGSLKAQLKAFEQEEITGEGGRLFHIPYVSQWGVGANKRVGDCGPAGLTSIVQGLTSYRPTVDEVAAACGQPESGEGSHYTTATQLVKGAAEFGVHLEYRRPLVTGLMVEYLLKDRMPSIPLIDYKELREQTNHLGGIVRNQDQKFSGGHWVVFVGWEDARGVYIHDPNFWGETASYGAFRWIPWDAWINSLGSPAAGNRYGDQGLVVVGLN